MFDIVKAQDIDSKPLCSCVFTPDIKPHLPVIFKVTQDPMCAIHGESMFTLEDVDDESGVGNEEN